MEDIEEIEGIEEIKEYTILRLNNYDINCDHYINDVYSIFYKGIEYKKTGRNVIIEVIAKTNLTMDVVNIKNIIRNCDKIDVIYKILDVFECEQNLYIVWEDFIIINEKVKVNGGENRVNGGENGINGEINDKLIEQIFKSLQKIFIFVVDNELLIDVIKYEDIHSDRIMIRPQKKRKTIVYGSPIYSPHKNGVNKRKNGVNGGINGEIYDKVNGGINRIEEDLIINISILMYELIIKRINPEFAYTQTEIEDSESIFSDFLLMLFDSNINIKTKSYIIRNTKNIKNQHKNKNNNKQADVLLDSEIFHFEL